MPKKKAKSSAKTKISKKHKQHLKKHLDKVGDASGNYIKSVLKVASYHPKHGKKIQNEVAHLMRRLHKIHIMINKELKSVK